MAMEALRVAAKESRFMKFILGGFIALAVGGLVFTDVHGFFTGNAGGTTIVRVDDTKIDVRQFDNEFQNFLRQTGLINQGFEQNLVETFLQSRINNTLRQQAANELDIMMGNDAIANQIRGVFGPGVSKDQIEMTLRAQGMSADDLANQIRVQTAMTLLNSLPNSITAHVPTYVSDIIGKTQNEARTATVLTIPLNKLYDDVNVTDQDILNYYNENTALFTTAETRILNIGTLSLSDVKDNLPEITEADLRAEYNARLDDFTIPEKRSIIQIQIENPDDAQAVYESALQNGDLALAVKDILGDDAKPTDPAAFEYSALPEELADAVFSNTRNVGDVTPPVESIFGNVVAQITDVTKESAQSFDTIQKDLRTAMEQNAEYDALYNIIVDIEDMIDNGQNYDEIIALAPLTTKSTDELTLDNFDAKAPDNLKSALENSPSLKDEIFTLPLNGVAYPIEIDEENYILISVKSINGGVLQPLDNVRSDINDILIEQNKTAIANIELESILTALMQSKTTLDKVKADKDGKSRTVNKLKSGESTTAAATLIYNADYSGYNVGIDGDNAIIVRIDAIDYGTDKNDDTNGTIQSSQRMIVDSLLGAYYRDNASVSINETLLNQYVADRQ